MDIHKFLKENDIPTSFDENFYMETYEKVANFYEPYCSENGISDKERLYFHFMTYGRHMGFQPHARHVIKSYEEFDEQIINEPLSVVVSCRDREDMLNISIRSWLLHRQIKEIIIVDWSSEKSIKHFEDIDPRITVIRIEGEEFYNASKPINLAIKEARHEKILKMDVDYILNPYLPLASLVDISHGEFVCGNWRQYHLDNDLGFMKNLNGILCCHKDLIIKAGMYNEEIDNYGREDCEMFERLQEAGGKRKNIEFKRNHVPVYHNPHSVKVRGNNRKDPDVISTMMYFQKKFGTNKFELIINLYRDKNEDRRNEILKCLKTNLQNEYIKHIHIFLEDWKDFPEFYEILDDNKESITVIKVDDRVSFKSIFKYCNENLVNEQCIIANSDIVFTDDLKKIRGLHSHDFLALTRHEDEELIKNSHREGFCSQDAWIFRSPMIQDISEELQDEVIGSIFSDNLISYLLYASEQYNCWNLCKDVKIYHMHKTTTPHHEKFTKEQVNKIKIKYCLRYGDNDIVKLLVATDIEDYYNGEMSNYFISWGDFQHNDYKY